MANRKLNERFDPYYHWERATNFKWTKLGESDAELVGFLIELSQDALTQLEAVEYLFVDVELSALYGRQSERDQDSLSKVLNLFWENPKDRPNRLTFLRYSFPRPSDTDPRSSETINGFKYALIAVPVEYVNSLVEGAFKNGRVDYWQLANVTGVNLEQGDSAFREHGPKVVCGIIDTEISRQDLHIDKYFPVESRIEWYNAESSEKSARGIFSHGHAVFNRIHDNIVEHLCPIDGTLLFSLYGVPDREMGFWDTKGAWLNWVLFQGVCEITKKAIEDSAELIVINISLGNNAGPHDGTSLICKALRDLCDRVSTLRLVFSAGNSHTEDLSRKYHIKASESADFIVRVQPDDASPTFVELWLDDLTDLSISVTAPSGGSRTSVGVGNVQEIKIGSEILATASLVGKDNASNGEGCMFLLAIVPSFGSHSTAFHAQGDWKICVENTGQAGPVVCVKGWIQNDSQIGNASARRRQAYFYDRHTRFREPDTLRRISNNEYAQVDTCSGIACIEHKNVLNCGAHIRSNEQMAEYSPSSELYRVFCSAVAEESPSVPWTLSKGTAPGSLVRFNGTSAAASVISALLISEFFKTQSTTNSSSIDAKKLIVNMSVAQHDVTASTTNSNRGAFLVKR